MYETVLLPTDGSEVAAGAVEHAIDAAQRHDATVHVLYVVDESVANAASGLAMGEINAELEDEGERAIAELEEAVGEAGLDTAANRVTGVRAPGRATRRSRSKRRRRRA